MFSAAVEGRCEADAGAATASYQAQFVTCTAAECGAPSVEAPHVVSSGCLAKGVMGGRFSPRTTQWRDIFLKAVQSRKCRWNFDYLTPFVKSPTSKYH